MRHHAAPPPVLTCHCSAHAGLPPIAVVRVTELPGSTAAGLPGWARTHGA